MARGAPAGDEVVEIPADAPHHDADAPVGRADDDARRILKLLRTQVEDLLAAESRRVERLEEGIKDARAKLKERKQLLKRAAKHQELVHPFLAELGLAPDRPITPIPPIPPNFEQLEMITVERDRVYIRLIRDKRSGLVHYEVIEPPLQGVEREAYSFVRDTLIRTMYPKPTTDPDELERIVTTGIEEVILDHLVLVDEVAKARIQHHLLRDFLGYGRIDPMMHDPMVEDISCDGPGIPLYVFHREHQSVRTNVVFPTESELDGFVVRLAQMSGKSISIAEPLLDATLPDGSRLQTTLAREVTTRGSSFTIRRVRSDPLTPPDLVRLGTISSEMASLLWLAMENGESMIVAGGTASGKTTTMNAVALFIPPHKKIVTIEDTREIALLHENWVADVTRKAFAGEASGDINMYRLLEAALRQRPEYLIVGEVRGVEAMTLFQAMATGHATYSTMHADSIASAVHRLEHPPISVPRIMLSNLDAMMVQVQARRGHRMVRRVKDLTEVVGMDPETGDLLTNAVFRWDSRADKHVYLGKSSMLQKIAELHNMSLAEIEREWVRRTRVLDWMVQKGVRNVRDVWQVVTAYLEDPDALETRLQAEADKPEAHIVGG